jgi:omega-hydroxy-beta-dihydromenaquinone-9 sulfotransferase
VLNWLEPAYQRWLAQHGELGGDACYVEVNAEDLAARWPTSRTELFERLGLPDAQTASAFTPSRL